MADLVPVPVSVQLVSGPYVNATFGETVSAGMAVYRDSANSQKLMKTDTNVAGKKDCYGVTLDAGDADETGRVAISGAVINLGVTLGVGTLYLASETAGGIQPVADLGAGEDVIVVGIGQTADNFLVHVWDSAVAKA